MDQAHGSSLNKIRGKEENKILTVSTYQMVILMQFNDYPRSTFEQLVTNTKILEKEVKRSLQSLSMGKQSQRILCRKGTGKEIGKFLKLNF